MAVIDQFLSLMLDIGREYAGGRIQKYISDRKEISKLKSDLNNYLNNQLATHRQSGNNNEEFDFEGLLEYLQNNLLQQCGSVLFEIDPDKRKQSEEQIINAAVNYAKPSNPDADSRLKEIIISCIDIIRCFYEDKIRPEDAVLAEKQTKTIIAHQQKVKNEILEEIISSKDQANKQIRLDERISNAQKAAIRFAQGFHAPLFAESEGNCITLDNVYVQNHIKYGNHIFNSFEEFHASVVSNDSAVLIEGEAGMGKSSMVMEIADKYSKGLLFSGEVVYFIPGKDLRRSEGDPIEDIQQYLMFQFNIEDDLHHAIIFLDAYDEISYVSESTDNNNRYLRKILEYINYFRYLIITSRTGYIEKNGMKRASLLKFNAEQREEFIARYNRCSREAVSNDYIKKLADASVEIENILGIPMLLYMILVNHIDPDGVNDRYTLYRKVFGTKEQPGAIQRSRNITGSLWGDLFELACRIAHLMYKHNNLYAERSEIESLINGMKLDSETENILKNRFGIEIYLAGNQDQLFTYIHKSIYDFFASNYICLHLKETFRHYLYSSLDINTVISDLNEIYNAETFSSDIMEYIMQCVKDGVFDSLYINSKENLNKLVSLFKKIMNAQLYREERKSKEPYWLSMKNMMLWVFNTFSIIFSRIEYPDLEYIDIDPSLISFLIQTLDYIDTLFLCHLNLTSCVFQHIDFKETFFIDNLLTDADFSYSYMNIIVAISQKFDDMSIRETDFFAGSFSDISFKNTDLRGSDFGNTVFLNVDFTGADLRNIKMDGAKFINCTFKNAAVHKEDIIEAELENCDLSEAEIHNKEEID